MKKKLKLNELHVQSFVTDVNAENVKGGVDLTIAVATRYNCYSIDNCPVPTLPVAQCTYYLTYHQCPSAACSVPIDTCLNVAL